MAEFIELFLQKRRICKRFYDNRCEGCPLNDSRNLCGVMSIIAVSEDEAMAFEKTVTQWAAEHPEPVYPTWEEWLQSVGVMESSEGLLRRIKGQLYIDGIPAHAVPTAKVLQPMDADIAQKLGIEPKEK